MCYLLLKEYIWWDVLENVGIMLLTLDVTVFVACLSQHLCKDFASPVVQFLRITAFVVCIHHFVSHRESMFAFLIKRMEVRKRSARFTILFIPPDHIYIYIYMHSVCFIEGSMYINIATEKSMEKYSFVIIFVIFRASLLNLLPFASHIFCWFLSFFVFFLIIHPCANPLSNIKPKLPHRANRCCKKGCTHVATISRQSSLEQGEGVRELHDDIEDEGACVASVTKAFPV